ncbi:hypothetical protein [Achromobacter mucicolens]|uniref:hypothetical protein n=1 Tax=Achromobacter mucicolens TaxID=1389922 RepID=UPI000B07D118|nr:hypothetical protein [Achromobacter mucicolens]
MKWISSQLDVLGADGTPPDGGLSAALERDFGSSENWRAEFTSLRRAVGSDQFTTWFLSTYAINFT